MTSAVVEQPQHLDALELANATRSARAVVRRDLKAMSREASRQALASLIENPTDLWNKAELGYMLRMAAGVRHGMAARWLERAGLAPNKLFGELTDRQRRILAEAVRG